AFAGRGHDRADGKEAHHCHPGGRRAVAVRLIGHQTHIGIRSAEAKLTGMDADFAQPQMTSRLAVGRRPHHVFTDSSRIGQGAPRWPANVDGAWHYAPPLRPRSRWKLWAKLPPASAIFCKRIR